MMFDIVSYDIVSYDYTIQYLIKQKMFHFIYINVSCNTISYHMKQYHITQLSIIFYDIP